MGYLELNESEGQLMDDIERRVIALEGQGKIIERLEAQLHGLDGKVDKLLSAAGSIELFKSAHTENKIEVGKIETAVVNLSADVNQVSRDVLAKWSMARGIITAGTLFFAILQAMVAVMWSDLAARVESDHEAVMAIQHRHETEQTLRLDPGG